MRRTAAQPVVLLLLAAVAGGCGKGDLDRGDDLPTVPAAATPDVERALPAGLTDAERAAAGIVLKYARAIADGNYERACATRVRAERERLARDSGSCERALLLNFRGRPRALFATIEAGAVRVRGDLAGVDLRQPGGAVELTLAARRVRDRWRVEDVPDARVP